MLKCTRKSRKFYKFYKMLEILENAMKSRICKKLQKLLDIPENAVNSKNILRWSKIIRDFSEMFSQYQQVQDVQNALKLEEIDMASARPERHRRAGRRKKAHTSDHPPLLFDQIIFFVLFILNFQIFLMFKSFQLVMWTKSFISSAVLYLHL